MIKVLVDFTLNSQLLEHIISIKSIAVLLKKKNKNKKFDVSSFKFLLNVGKKKHISTQ